MVFSRTGRASVKFPTLREMRDRTRSIHKRFPRSIRGSNEITTRSTRRVTVKPEVAIEGEEILSSRNLPQFVERNANELQKADGALFPRAAQEPPAKHDSLLAAKA